MANDFWQPMPELRPFVSIAFGAALLHTGTRWIFTEGRNCLNANSHCDVAWSAALSTCTHSENRW